MSTRSEALLKPILEYMRDTPMEYWPLSFIVSPENMVEQIKAQLKRLARENYLTDEDSQRAVVILSSSEVERPLMFKTDEMIAICGKAYFENKISRFKQILKDDRARKA
jgi:hypothetical protein